MVLITVIMSMEVFIFIQFWLRMPTFCAFLYTFVKMVQIRQILGLWNCAVVHIQKIGIMRKCTRSIITFYYNVSSRTALFCLVLVLLSRQNKRTIFLKFLLTAILICTQHLCLIIQNFIWTVIFLIMAAAIIATFCWHFKNLN